MDEQAKQELLRSLQNEREKVSRLGERVISSVAKLIEESLRGFDEAIDKLKQ